MQLPSLTEDGAVTFTGPEMIERSWSAYVSRGALAVKPARKLMPLEQLEVYLMGGGIGTPIPVRVEVVHLGPEHALLRMLDAPPPKPKLALQGAMSREDVASKDAPGGATGSQDASLDAHGGPSQNGASKPEGTTAEGLHRPGAMSVPRASRTTELDGRMLAPEDDPPAATQNPAAPAEVNPSARGSIALEPIPIEPVPREPITLEPLEPILLEPIPREPISLEPIPSERPKPPVVFAEKEAPPIVLEPIASKPVESKPVVEPQPAESRPAQADKEASAPSAPATTADATVPEIRAPPSSTSLEDPIFPKAQATPAVMPPLFTGDALRFMSRTDFDAARKDLDGIGAVLAVCDGKPPAKPVDVRLIVADREARTKVKIVLSAMSPGTVVAQAVEKGGFKPAIADLEMSPTMAVAPPRVDADAMSPGAQPAVAKAFSLPKSGTLWNPTTAEGVLAMPLLRTPTEAELKKPSVPLLLRWLRSTRGVMRVEITAPEHPVFTIILVDGREVRSSAALSILGRSLALPQMTYTIVDLPRAPQMSHTGRTLHLIGEIVRALCSQLPTEELARAFPKHPDKCARAITDVVQGLNLPPQHQRFVKTDVDGSQFIDEIARAAVGQRTVWETLYLLELYNGLSWDEPPEGKTARMRAQITTKVQAPTSDHDDHDAWAPFEGKDHFQVLGLHWSSSPSEVGPAFHKLRTEYGPAGIKRPSDPKIADKIMKRLEEAYRVLNDAHQRQAYRREKYNLQWAHQAQLLVQKAKIAIYRKDWLEATNILLAAEDMSPSNEAKELLAQIKTKQAGKPS